MQRYQRQAEILWQMSRRLISVDVDHEFDRTLQVNRGLLNHIAVELEEEMPDQLRGHTETRPVADEDNETSGDDDEGPGSESHDDSDEDQDSGDGDDISHDVEGQEVEALENQS